MIIHQCNNGHILCQKCRHPNQTTCPYLHCQAPLNLPNPNRNLLCEKVLTLLPLECSFLEHGCKASEIKNAEQLLLHEKKCPYRLIRCIYPLCQSLVPINTLPNHILDTSHSIHVVSPSFGAIDTSEVRSYITRIGSIMNSRIFWKVTQIQLDGRFALGRKHFFTELVQISPGPDSDWVFWIYMLATENEACEYEYKTTFESYVDSTSTQQFDGRCISVDKPIESILNDASSNSFIASNSLIVISHQLITNFINPSDGSLKIIIDIKKSSHKLPMAISLPGALNLSDNSTQKNLSKSDSDLSQVIRADEYACRMLQNVSQTYKQIDKICSISGQATGFEKGPYSRSRQTQNKIFKRQKQKSKYS